MPSYTLMSKPQIYYYTAYGATNAKQLRANPKICIDRANPNCIDYTYPGINKATHSKTSGFSLVSDVYGPYFKKNDLVRFRIINTTQGAGSYRSTLNSPMQWDTAFSAEITVGEMKKLGTGKQLILMDIYSVGDDTTFIFDALDTEFTP